MEVNTISWFVEELETREYILKFVPIKMHLKNLNKEM